MYVYTYVCPAMFYCGVGYRQTCVVIYEQMYIHIHIYTCVYTHTYAM